MDVNELTVQLQAALAAQLKAATPVTNDAQLQKVCRAIAAAVAQVIAPRLP